MRPVIILFCAMLSTFMLVGGRALAQESKPTDSAMSFFRPPLLLEPAGRPACVLSAGHAGADLVDCRNAAAPSDPAEANCASAEPDATADARPSAANAALARDLQRIYPFGKPACGFFGATAWSGARWLFFPASETREGSESGAFLFVAPRIEGLATSNAVLRGRWRKQDARLVVHAKSIEMPEATLSLDGVVTFAADEYHYAIVFAAAAQGESRMEQFQGSLRPVTEASANGDSATARLEAMRAAVPDALRASFEGISRLEPSGRVDEYSRIQPSTIPNGIFDGAIAVDIEGVGPVSVPVAVFAIGDTGEAASLTISSTGALGPGWLMLDSNHSGTPKLVVVTSPGKLRAKLADAPGAAPDIAVAWQAPKMGHDGSPQFAQVAATSGTIDLHLDSDTLSGTVDLFGVTVDADARKLAYKGVLNAKLRRSAVADALRERLGASALEGEWTSAHDLFDSMSLSRSAANEMRGNYSGRYSGEIRGSDDGETLDLRWRDQRGEGWATARLLPDGATIAGLWQPLGRADEPRGFLADQQISLDPAAINSVDLNELRWLSDELRSRGRVSQSVAIERVLFDRSIETAKQVSQDPNASFLAEQGELVSAAKVIQGLVDGEFALGDWKHMLGDLKRAVELQSQLSPQKYLSRLIEPRLLEFRKIEQGWGSTLDVLAQQPKIQLSMLEAAGIGVSFGVQDGAVVITGTAPGQGAATAGVLTGDRLVEIDGAAVVPPADGDLREVSARLRGAAGSDVKMRITRDGVSKVFTVVRQRLYPMVPERERAIANTVSTVGEALEAIRGALAVEIVPAVGNGSVDSVLPKLQATSATLDQARERLLAVDPKTFLDAKWALTLRTILDGYRSIGAGRFADAQFASDMDRLETSFEKELKNNQNTELNFPQKQLCLLLLKSSELGVLIAFNARKNYQATVDMTKPSAVANYGRIYTGLTMGLSRSIDDWRTRLRGDEAKIAALDAGKDFFDELIQLLVDIDEPNLALVASEQARARAFQDLLASRRLPKATLAAADSAEIVPKGWLESLGQASSIGLEDWKGLVQQRKATVVEYYLARDRVFAWCGSGSGAPHFVKLDIAPKALVEKVINLSGLLQGQKIESDKEIISQLRDLYQDLIAPIGGFLPNSPEDEVVIIPYGELGLVPFGALLDPSGKFLLEQHTVSYAQSVGEFRFVARRDMQADSHLLALGDPRPMPNTTEPFATLPDVPTTLNEIAALFGPSSRPSVRLGEDASIAALRSEGSAASSIVFLTHAIADPQDPLNSYIALAKVGASDGRLGIPQIATLRLRAEVVVLGACSTGRGKPSADGINSLSRAFAAAGASSVMMTLWDAPANSTATQIETFYRLWLQKKVSKAAALRHAQLDLLDIFERLRDSPRVWAPLVLYGDGR